MVFKIISYASNLKVMRFDHIIFAFNLDLTKILKIWVGYQFVTHIWTSNKAWYQVCILLCPCSSFAFWCAKCLKVSFSKTSLWTFNLIAYKLFLNKIVNFLNLDCDNNLEYSTCKIGGTMRFNLNSFFNFFFVSFPNILNLKINEMRSDQQFSKPILKFETRKYF
jgi:hypothetical protein